MFSTCFIQKQQKRLVNNNFFLYTSSHPPLIFLVFFFLFPIAQHISFLFHPQTTRHVSPSNLPESRLSTYIFFFLFLNLLSFRCFRYSFLVLFIVWDRNFQGSLKNKSVPFDKCFLCASNTHTHVDENARKFTDTLLDFLVYIFTDTQMDNLFGKL